MCIQSLVNASESIAKNKVLLLAAICLLSVIYILHRVDAKCLTFMSITVIFNYSK